MHVLKLERWGTTITPPETGKLEKRSKSGGSASSTEDERLTVSPFGEGE
jgi:hypothetical protein